MVALPFRSLNRDFKSNYRTLFHADGDTEVVTRELGARYCILCCGANAKHPQAMKPSIWTVQIKIMTIGVPILHSLDDISDLPMICWGFLIRITEPSRKCLINVEWYLTFIITNFATKNHVFGSVFELHPSLIATRPVLGWLRIRLQPCRF